MRAKKLFELTPSAFVLLINVGVNLSLSAPGAFSLLKPEELSNSDVLEAVSYTHQTLPTKRIV